VRFNEPSNRGESENEEDAVLEKSDQKLAEEVLELVRRIEQRVGQSIAERIYEEGQICGFRANFLGLNRLVDLPLVESALESSEYTDDAKLIVAGMLEWAKDEYLYDEVSEQIVDERGEIKGVSTNKIHSLAALTKSTHSPH